LRRGQRASFAGYQLRYVGSSVHPEPQRTVFVATLALSRGGRQAGVLIPSLNIYPNSTEPIGTPSISKGTPANGFRDLYASLRCSGSAWGGIHAPSHSPS